MKNCNWVLDYKHKERLNKTIQNVLKNITEEDQKQFLEWIKKYY